MRLQIRVRTLILGCALAVLAASAVPAYYFAPVILRAHLGGVIGPGALSSAVTAARQAVVLAGLFAAALGLVLGLVAAGVVSADLDRLQRAAARASRGARARVSLRVVELDALASMLSRIAREARQRVGRIARERDEAVLLLNSVGEGILQLDAEGRIIRVNDAAVRLLGLPADAEGQPVASLIRHAELRETLQRAARGEAVGSRELRLEDRRLLVGATALGGDDGARGAVAALVDLTELRRLEGVRRDFVANASHELKTPLTSIRGYVETLLGDEPAPETRERFLMTIRHNADRLHRIVEDLLDLSRVESGRWQPQHEPVLVPVIAREAWAEFEERAREKEIAFVVESDRRTPIPADRTALRQIFANLFDNALRHTPPGGRITVRVSTDQQERSPDGRPVVVEVRDTGTGIPGDALDRIFERFYRVDPARSRSEGGTGLGLAIVKHLVEHMGGRVGASSRLGDGACIRFVLPVSGAVEAPAGG